LVIIPRPVFFSRDKHSDAGIRKRDRLTIKAMISKAQEFGEIKYLVNAAGVSPSHAPIEAILKVALFRLIASPSCWRELRKQDALLRT